MVARQFHFSSIPRYLATGLRYFLGGITPHRASFFGLLFAVIFFWASLEPSLLPRPWYLQVLLSVIVCIIAYGIGTFIAWLVRLLLRAFGFSRSMPKRGWYVLGLLSVLLLTYQLIRSALWQHEMYKLIGTRQPQLDWLRATLGVLVLTIFFSWVVIGIITVLYRLLRAVFYWLRDKRLTRFVHPQLLRSIIAIGLLSLLVWIANGTFLRVINNATNDAFKTQNDITPKGVAQPMDPLKSGSPDSLISWNNLGYQGKQFVAGAPTTQQIAAVTGKPAMDPIRAYVGLDETGGDIPTAAHLAVSELKRTNAFDRRAILIVVTTGTGWVDAGSAKPLEYLLNGDVATVAIQYSYYPSWISFLKDRERVVEAAHETIQQVDDAVAALPGGAHHPHIFLFGESLGSFGAESAAEAHGGISKDISGAVLVGPPGFNPLHNQLTDQRMPGSPSYDPVVNNEKDVVFATDTTQLDAVHTNPRLIYIQNPTDPVAKWNTKLLWKKPPWLEEEKQAGLLAPHFTWTPITTFFQVTVDMILAFHEPPGYGHSYGTHAEAAWEILTGTHLTAQQRTQITQVLEAK